MAPQGPLDGLDPVTAQDVMAKACVAKTAKEWVEVYIAVVEERLKQLEVVNPSSTGLLRERWNSAQGHLRRTAAKLDNAGLDLNVVMKAVEPKVKDVYVGSMRTGEQPIWGSTPRMILEWPDGQQITFKNDEAVHGFGFFMYWEQMQLAVLDPAMRDAVLGGGRRRIINPGEAEHRSYFEAKRRDQESGTEPE